MMTVIIVVLVFLVLALLFVSEKKVKFAMAGLGATIISATVFAHYVRLVSFTGPVVPTTLALVALIAMVIFTLIAFFKK